MPLFNWYLCVCVTFVVFTDCESCARPISTKPGSMEAGEYGLTRGACFVARRLEVVVIAGLLWISWCVWVRRDFGEVFRFFFFERTRSAASMRPPCLIYLSTSTGGICSVATRKSSIKFGTASIPYRTLLLGSVLIPLPYTSVSSARPPKIPRLRVHSTKHNHSTKAF